MATKTTKGIYFACPKCGGDRLMRAETALHRYSNLSIELDESGELCIVEQELFDDFSGDVLGYRCMDCRYPDCEVNSKADGFHWKTLKDAQAAGSILWLTDTETVQHKCMICSMDGKMIPVVVDVSHPGPLSEDERKQVLDLEQVKNGILISQSDSGIRSLACSNWKKVRHYTLQNFIKS